jgi:hypothetical protein
MAAPLDSTSEGLCLNTYLQRLQAEEDVDSKAAALNAARSELRQLEKRRKELRLISRNLRGSTVAANQRGITIVVS